MADLVHPRGGWRPDRGGDPPDGTGPDPITPGGSRRRRPKLTSGELAQNGSFEAGVSPWVPGNNTGFGIYANGQISPSDAAYAGTHYAAMNTSSPGGGLYEDIGGLSISPGDTFCGSAQVRDQLQETGARGSFVVWLIGGSSNEAGSDVFSNLGNGPNWSQVSTCVTATSSHTQVRIQFYPTPGTPTLDVDAVDVHHALQVAAPLTQNGGFESGPAPWQVGSNSNYVVYANGQIAPNDVAFAGTHYAATNTSAPGGGFYQDITGQSISPGDTVCGSARVRDQLQETGAQGSFVIWLIGGSSNESGVANFSNLGNGANWQPVSTCVTASTAHTQVRVQFFPTPGTPTLDVDAVVANDYRDIQESISQNGSFEAGASPWVPGNNTGFGIYANGQISPSDAAYAGTHYAAMNTSSPGGGLYEDIAGLSIAPGDTFCGSAEIRDQLQETGAQGSFVVWLIGGSSNEAGSDVFSNLGNGPNWTAVSTLRHRHQPPHPGPDPVLPDTGDSHPRRRRGGDGERVGLRAQRQLRTQRLVHATDLRRHAVAATRRGRADHRLQRVRPEGVGPRRRGRRRLPGPGPVPISLAELRWSGREPAEHDANRARQLELERRRGADLRGWQRTDVLVLGCARHHADDHGCVRQLRADHHRPEEPITRRLHAMRAGRHRGRQQPMGHRQLLARLLTIGPLDVGNAGPPLR